MSQQPSVKIRRSAMPHLVQVPEMGGSVRILQGTSHQKSKLYHVSLTRMRTQPSVTVSVHDREKGYLKSVVIPKHLVCRFAVAFAVASEAIAHGEAQQDEDDV